MKTYGRTIFFTGALVNVVMTLAFFTGFLGALPFSDPWVAAGALGLVASVAQLAGSVTLGSAGNAGNAVAGVLASLGAVISGIGWGSWLVVGLTADPGDPVINVTGLLIAPGVLFSLIALVVLLISGRVSRATSLERTYAGVFGGATVLLFVARVTERFLSARAMEELSTQIGNEEFNDPGFYEIYLWAGVVLSVIAFAVGVMQIVIAVRSSAPTQARMFSGIAGVSVITGGLLLSIALWPLSILLSMSAVAVERRAASSPPPVPPMPTDLPQ